MSSFRGTKFAFAQIPIRKEEFKKKGYGSLSILVPSSTVMNGDLRRIGNAEKGTERGLQIHSDEKKVQDKNGKI